MVCGNMFFFYCPMLPIVQTAWMVDCGYERVIVKGRNFVVSDLDLKRVFRKTLEKANIFDNLTLINTKMLEMDHQDRCRLNNWSIFYAFFKGITWWTESLIFWCQHIRWKKFLQRTINIVTHGNWHNIQFFFPNGRTEATVACNSSSQGARE